MSKKTKKEFKTPQFLKDAISRLEKEEQEEWNKFIFTHSPVEIFYAKMQKDLFNIQQELFSFETMYGIKLEINIKKYE